MVDTNSLLLVEWMAADELTGPLSRLFWKQYVNLYLWCMG